MIAYEWDEAKRRYNLDRRGLDFADAWQVYEAEDKMTLRSPYPQEERWMDMAEVNGRVVVLVYTMRGDAVRCISLRYAKRGKERSMYYGQDR